MTCQQFEKSLSPYLDKVLSTQEMERMSEHLRACPACRAEYEAQRMLKGVLGDLPDAELPPHFHERLHASLREEHYKKEGGNVKRKLNLPMLSAVAAGLLVVVLAGALILGGSLDMKDSASRAGDYGYSGYDTDGGGTLGLSGQGDASKNAESAATPQMPAPAADSEERSQTQGDTVTSQDGQNPDNTVAEGRKIIYSAEVGVRTRQFDADVESVRQACAAAGGYVESAYIQGVGFDQPGGTGRTATITVRIPQIAYAPYLDQVTGVGQMTSKREYTDDITAAYFDSETRLHTLELQLQTLEDILGKSEKLEDVVLLVQEIADVTNEMEQIKGQLRLWDDLVDYSRVTVTLTEVQESTYVEPVDPTLSERMAVAFFGTLNAMKRGLQSFAVGTVGATPYIVLLVALALIAVAIIVPVRRRRNRRRSLPPAADKE